MKQYGLVGHPLDHSFSKQFFTDKFIRENLTNCTYKNFDIKDISQVKTVVNNTPELMGFNVTIPYKEQIIPYLHKIDSEAAEVGAVNTVKITNGKWTGYNTDIYGFKQSLKPFLEISQERALILGTGGASKAVYYVLNSLNINCLFVSRTPKKDNEISYNDVNEYVIRNHQIIVNTTPIGTFPKIDEKPEICYNEITSKHLLYDLIYNPDETQFLKEGRKKGATTINGLQMLKIQAEKSWKIWNE
ncbi:MAG: shikimate dehydrogenase [Flavobacteriales bacterium]|nr:shikimate dehydrogenase [Flavobacteriales bacterium]